MVETDVARVSHVELGCGSNKRDGFFGIDYAALPGVDLVLDVENHALPFEENQLAHVYSSHMLEHVREPMLLLREILRVCRHDALVEIWTPHGRANDAFLYGHTTFLNEMHFKHICFEYDRFYFRDYHGYLNWETTHYVLYPGILEQLSALHIPIEFALEHMCNIALEWGVFLRVKKDLPKAPGPQLPRRVYSMSGDHREKLVVPAM